MFWAVSLLTYNLSTLCLIIQHSSLPFRVYILTDKIFTIPRYIQVKMYFYVKTYTPCLRLSSVPAKMLFELPTIIGFAENQLSWSVLSFTKLTIVLRISMQRYLVRTVYILTMVRSPGFGSNIRHLSFF